MQGDKDVGACQAADFHIVEIGVAIVEQGGVPGGAVGEGELVAGNDRVVWVGCPGNAVIAKCQAALVQIIAYKEHDPAFRRQASFGAVDVAAIPFVAG